MNKQAPSKVLCNRMSFDYSKHRIISSKTKKNILGTKKYTYFTLYPSKKNAQVTPMVIVLSWLSL